MLIALILFWSSCVHAEIPRDFVRVSSMDESPGDTLLFLEDGRVGRLNHSETLLPEIKHILHQNSDVLVLLSTEGNVIRVKSAAKEAGSGRSTIDSEKPKNLAPEPPSIVSETEAQDVFQSMNPNYRRRSQCFNRAHVWTYETFQSKGIHLMKVFMFFTSKYIREYRYRWWFHVSPFAIVETNGEKRESILDHTFMNGPVGPKEWSDHFIEPRTPCPTVNRYSDYSNHQYDHYCYFMKVPMYFWQPRHLEALEAGTPAPESFVRDEVLAAYSQAFFGAPRTSTRVKDAH